MRAKSSTVEEPFTEDSDAKPWDADRRAKQAVTREMVRILIVSNIANDSIVGDRDWKSDLGTKSSILLWNWWGGIGGGGILEPRMDADYQSGLKQFLCNSGQRMLGEVVVERVFHLHEREISL